MREVAHIRAGRPGREAAQALGDHVLAVADSLFVKNGYGATSMATVATRARVGKQTLYRRFPDKATLFREVIRRRIDSMFAAVPIPLVRENDPLAELKSLVNATLDLVLDPEFAQLYRIVIAEAMLFPELGADAADQWGSYGVVRCCRAVERAQLAGLCRAGDPNLIAKCLLWSALGPAFHNVITGAGSPFLSDAAKLAHLDRVWTLFLEGVTPGGRARNNPSA